MGTDIAIIRAEPHVEIGSIIARDTERLVSLWCECAVAEQPTASRVHLEALRNDLPAFLRAMAAGLMQAGDGDPQRHRARALEHGEQRWDKGWSITELVRDYQILQLVLLEHLEAVLERPLRYREIMAVGVFFKDAIAASVAAYVANNDLEIRNLERERVEALREADRRKDQFLAFVAHELRNPLSPILNSARALALMLPNADPQVRESIQIIRRQARQLGRLLEDLSDLTRIAQGQLKIRSDIVDVAEIIRQAIQTSTPLMKRRGHNLTSQIPEQRVSVKGDPVRLVQSIVNLLNNAAKYTPPGGAITVSAEQQGTDVVIRVSDTGIGVPAEMVDRIFDLYTRGDGAEAHSPDGRGIGLALVKNLVALHGGSVECVSRGRGLGAEFILRLPTYEGPLSSGGATPPEAIDIKSKRVLIVEDDVDNRTSLTTLVGLMGHAVESAADADGALRQASTSTFDVAIIDIGLPDRSGYEVAKEIRRQVGGQIKLIAATGYGLTEDADRALEAGFDAHLVKPLDMDAVARLLGCRRST